MVFGRRTLYAHKVIARTKVSRELLADAPNAGSLTESALGGALAASWDDAVVDGAGVGNQPLGLSAIAQDSGRNVTNTDGSSFQLCPPAAVVSA